MLRVDSKKQAYSFMLDSGSEVNLARLHVVPDENLINRDHTYVLNGIGASPTPCLGTIRLKVAGYETEFLVVPDSFPIPFAGIIGSEFFTKTKAKINFEDKTFVTDKCIITLNQKDNPIYEVEYGRIANLQKDDDLQILPFVEIINPPTGKSEKFLVDTGSEMNLIKQELLPSSITISTDKTVYIRGIGSELIPTLGYIEIKLLGIDTVFYVISNDVTIPGEGILGAEYFSNAKSIIDYEKKILRVENKRIPLIFTENRQLSNDWISSESIIESDEEMNHDNDENRYIDFGGVDDKFSMGHKYSHFISYQDTLSELNIEHLSDSYPMEIVKSTNSENGNTVSIFNIGIQDLVHTDHLNPEEKQYVIDLTTKNRDVFFLPGDSLPGTDLVTHKIPTKDDIPINARQYKFPHSLKEEINKQVQELLDNGIIQPSNSPYNTPLWIVSKKPDSQGRPRWRMVLDFRALNEKTISDAYPLPNITEIFDQVGGAKYYTVLDLASGFHQIKMDPADAHKTAFSSPFGHFEFKRMPFGLSNAPATFQRLMDNLLRGLQGNTLFVYLDDIVVYADSIEEHNDKINELFSRLRKAGLKLQIDKCEFLKRKVNYLGHVLSEEGLSPDPKKISAVKDFPTPRNVKNIRQFLGFAGYYRRFIKDFAKIAKPLSKLLQKNTTFEWTDRAQESFETLKNLLCNAPLLQFPNFYKPFNITTDASGYAVGGVLSQGEIGHDRPIAYTSRVLRGPELNYEIYEKEALAILHSVKSFRSYVYGKKLKSLPIINLWYGSKPRILTRESKNGDLNYPSMTIMLYINPEG